MIIRVVSGALFVVTLYVLVARRKRMAQGRKVA